MRALVIDDSRTTRMILGRLLRNLGFEVEEAGDGREGLKRVNESARFDLALVDWNMPIMNGLELVQAVRADAEHDALKLMMVTTETEMSQMILALEAGANEYVMKPFTEQMIAEKLQLMGVGQEVHS
jgi:two-component system chemotaxis response regulator CheY